MKRKELIKELILQNQSKSFDDILEREIELPVRSGKIISLTGVRRSGKTSQLLLAIKKLRQQNIDKANILYLNFEDERLKLKTEELELIIQSYRELFPEIKLQNAYFFFDEIQNVPAWEKFIRRLYDSVTENIFITGSNSQMLSSDIASSLRGRNITLEIFPLSFKEYLQFQNIDINYYLPENKAKIINQLKNFITKGAFPETLKVEKSYIANILQDYYYVMLFKDIIERYNIRNTSALKYFLNRLILNLSKPTSVHKIHNELKSAGFKTSKDSLYQYIDYVEAAYFAFRINKFNYSFVKQELTEKKIYFIDNGLINSLTYHYSDNFGKLLENAVFLHLRRLYGNNVYFYKEKYECDFIVFDKNKPDKIIQVSYDISNQDTYKREINGLEKACEYFKINKGLIITFEQEKETIKTANMIEIDIIPAYKYFLLSDKKFV